MAARTYEPSSLQSLAAHAVAANPGVLLTSDLSGLPEELLVAITVLILRKQRMSPAIAQRLLEAAEEGQHAYLKLLVSQLDIEAGMRCVSYSEPCR